MERVLSLGAVRLPDGAYKLLLVLHSSSLDLIVGIPGFDDSLVYSSFNTPVTDMTKPLNFLPLENSLPE